MDVAGGNRPVDLTSACILVVDDEDVVRRVTASVLRRLGYHVLEASSGTEGVRLAREQAGKLDLLITDVTLDDVSGVDVGIAFRKANPGRPVIFTSGYTAQDMWEMARREGAVFLDKPYDVTRMARVVEDALARAPRAAPRREVSE